MTRTLSRIRYARTVSAGTESPRLELSSLVDVAFLLLTFFLLTSTLDPREADLGLRMIPGSVAVPQTPFIPEVVRVEIKADGSIWCNQDQMEPSGQKGRHLPTLLARLRLETEVSGMISGGAESLVEITAADGVSGQRLMDVMDCVTEAGVTNVALTGFVE